MSTDIQLWTKTYNYGQRHTIMDKDIYLMDKGIHLSAKIYLWTKTLNLSTKTNIYGERHILIAKDIQLGTKNDTHTCRQSHTIVNKDTYLSTKTYSYGHRHILTGKDTYLWSKAYTYRQRHIIMDKERHTFIGKHLRIKMHTMDKDTLV